MEQFLSLLPRGLMLCQHAADATVHQASPSDRTLGQADTLVPTDNPKVCGMRVAVLGAGASGLPAIKCCLDEGIEPVCLERTDRLGGLWHYTEKVEEGQSCVMKSTVINTSKEIMAYSDYPIPAKSPMYMHNTKVLQYLESYASQFDLRKYIRFKMEVKKLEEAEDFADTGRWNLTVLDKTTGDITMETYDAVLVCTGHHAEKQIPNFEGLESFPGRVVHTNEYRDHVGFEDKRVVVVGIGNSGGDVAVELSRIASQVYLSTRRGAWITHRVFDNGYPLDMSIIRRVLDVIQRKVPSGFYNSIIEWKVNRRFDHENYGLKPNHRFDGAHPTVNDDLPNRIACGMVKIRPNIKRIQRSSVEFNDGTTAENVDVIILATGYKFGFPFIDHPALKVSNNQVQLYKYMFPPEIRPSTLAVIGCIQPIGAIKPISEIQCRWATRVFKKTCQLPSPGEMEADIAQKATDMKLRYVNSERHTIQVDYPPIMDEIAEQFGAKPDLGRMLLEDPVLAFRCFLGPFSPYQYRLQGPGTWAGARQAIMTIWDRTLAPTRGAPPPRHPPTALYVLGVLLVAMVIRWVLALLL